MAESKVFFERNSWYHRTKTLMPDHTIKYGKKGGFKTEEEAKEYEKIANEEFKKSLEKTIVTDKENISFKDYLIFWYENIYSPRVTVSSQMLGAYVLYDLILSNLKEDIKLRYVTTDFLDELLKKAARLCESAGNKSRELLNIAFKDALVDDFLIVNPLIGTKTYKRRKGKVVVFNKEELKKFLGLTYRENWYLEILLGLFCGLRKGEICALTFDDFDVNQCILQINKQLTRDGTVITDVDKGYRIDNYSLKAKSPKTQNSYRNIKVPKVVMQELETRREYIEKLKKNKIFKNQNYISCQPNGDHHSLSSLNTYITRLCNRNGLPPITVHSLSYPNLFKIQTFFIKPLNIKDFVNKKFGFHFGLFA